jgi:lipopolysaccharide export system protein LptA
MPHPMPTHHPSSPPRTLALLGLAWVSVLVLALAAPAARAEKADRSKQLVVEADRSGEMDGARGTTVFSGNAAVSQGRMVLRAERIEVREQADGYRVANAVGNKAKPATFRQRADGGNDETIEGHADRIDFDERANTVRFVGAASLRRLRGAAVAQEVNGNLIVWDNTAELFKVEGGAATAANPGGRVRVVLSPRPDAAASATPAPAPASATAPLAPVRKLGDRP